MQNIFINQAAILFFFFRVNGNLRALILFGIKDNGIETRKKNILRLQKKKQLLVIQVILVLGVFFHVPSSHLPLAVLNHKPQLPHL